MTEYSSKDYSFYSYTGLKINSHHIEIYKSLFRGREDIYAVRKEKGGKAGYMPEYDVDWTHWKEHQARGGGFDSYKYKKPVHLDDSIILSHLKGEKTCGIYPLMSDNTSFFIAVDFDGMNWQVSILDLHRTCKESEISSYIERSRSGNGGHLWIFFDDAFPAYQSRRILFELLRHAGIISTFDKEPSFDRLFPN